ncbi:biotin-dependent carboxyltransferase family protein [Flavobacteriaceae bacterium XHP0103]|uniref:5-oxoprolinase subunit C family protein n=1 Tax=Marixanthotalea marina TaxID=2844359 RepID=UPI002989A602|nr:biotin-dependent carboxyltransferase family protein [Marixanthotalea marina]MBU3821624.1 biotin-dependent carboxyltransferase family protein [Marixanthotalea marina]
MIKVLKPGFYTTVQDMGRFGYQQYGVPVSGAMDLYAASVANMLLGNSANNAVLEMTMTGPTLQFICKSAICISGADLSPKLNQQPIAINKEIEVKEGDILSFGKMKFGFRSYLAVSGGIKTDKVMNSRSLYQGVTLQSTIAKGDELPIELHSDSVQEKHAGLKIKTNYFDSKEIQVLKGTEFDKLPKHQQELLLSQEFTISKNNSRMAYQLEQELENNNLESIITSPVLPGTVQLTPSGKLIVLMRDCQTTGGYPRVLQLAENAINKLSQKMAGQVVTFKLVQV